MERTTGIIAVLIVAIIVAIGFRGLVSRRYELFSWRNLFLFGFVIFYGTGTFFYVNSSDLTALYTPGQEGWSKFVILLPLFFFLFWFSTIFGYKRLRGLRRIIPPLELPVTTPAVFLAIGTLLVFSFVSSFAGGGGYTVAVFGQVKNGLASVALGLATYYILVKKFNPMSWAVFITVLGAAVVISTVGASGRRGLLGVILIVPWMWYFTTLRYKKPTGTFIKLATVGSLGVFLLLAFTGMRREQSATAAQFDLEVRLKQFTQVIEDPEIQTHALEETLYSDAPLNTLFILENYPDSFDYLGFNDLIYIVVNPIPRMLFPDKPEALGKLLEGQMGAHANLGPGIIGHGWAAAGFVGVLVYAVLFGLAFGAADGILAHRAWNPFFVAVMGSNLGNVLGMPRGDVALFSVLIISAIGACMIVLYGLKAVFGMFMKATAPLPLLGEPFWAATQAWEDPAAEWEDEEFFTPSDNGYTEWSGEGDWDGGGGDYGGYAYEGAGYGDGDSSTAGH